MDVFPGKCGSVGSHLGLSPPPQVPEKYLGDYWKGFPEGRCPTCHPTTSVKELKETQSTSTN